MEERMKAMETLIEKQDRRIRALEDVHEIANIMGTYIYKHEVHKDAEFLNTIFAERDDISWEVANFGVFYGRNGVKRTLDAHSGLTGGEGDKPAQPPMARTGSMIMHTLTTPVIEIAGDGKTAKGVWISPGHETGIDEETGKHRGQWCWTKYGCDFVKEKGKWKLWHYHVYRIFRTPYDMDWTEEYEPKREVARKASATAPLGIEPDFPTTYDNPYTTKYVAQMVPAPPVPYETFDPATSYGPPGK
jgi:hypothetical protein